MELSILCDCGKQVVAAEGMAGTSIPCTCGRILRVPSLSEMRRLGAERTPDKVGALARSSRDQLRQLPIALLYGLVLTWMCFAALPLLYLAFAYAGPLAGLGALLILIGHIWFITQIFTGNPAAALIILLIPIIGSLLSIQFIIDHWRIAKWPLLCQVIGLFLFLGSSMANVPG
jgi:hypothetical protein